MADENKTAAHAHKPAVPATAPAPKPTYTPFAFRETKLRDNMIARLTDLQPDGNPEPTLLENIKTVAIAEIAAMPADCNALELIIEANATAAARQINIILFPKKL